MSSTLIKPNVLLPSTKNISISIAKFIYYIETADKLFDNTLNELNIFALAAKHEENETYTYNAMLKQKDKDQFFKAIEKEIADHSSRNHWSVMRTSELPPKAKIIMAIWSFKRKRLPNGTLLKHKARLCAHGGQQVWGENYWETYAPVVNWLSIRMILIVAKMLNLSSRCIDFVLAFPQADLDMDIYMKLPQGIQQVDGEKCVLKLNKSLYGLRQGSYNWFQKLKQALIDRDFCPSAVDPCVYLGKNAIAIVYVDDVIIVSKSNKILDSIVKSLFKGQENFDLTEKGTLEKYLGIEIKDLDKNTYELHQPHLIDRIIKFVGLEETEKQK